ncbi:MAG: glycosyltransferase [Planctomycetota bacterium]
MIFATVGTQLPFDRLTNTLDDWAAYRKRRDVFAQVGLSQHRPSWIEWKPTLSPADFNDRLASASVIVAHAGIGSILSALELGKPIVVMPRRMKHGEHRNDHQLATAERFASKGMVSVAWDEEQLRRRLDDLESITARHSIESMASTRLLERVRSFIFADNPTEMLA